MTAEYQVHGSVAVITLNNPPVNGLGLVTRTAAVKGIQQALADDAVKAIVITGAGKAFSGGADIKEFNSPKALTEPSLHTLIATAESATKPVVAAIHTVCMGGGLELSLGCHYRVAMPGAQIALPEVKLGLLPGAGGTQRLPRVLGLEMALNMIVSGTPVASEKLAGPRCSTKCSPPTPTWSSPPWPSPKSIADARPLPKVRDRKVDYPNHEAFLQFSRNTVKAMAGPFPAPLECVETVAASVTMKFEDGLKFERERFLHLIQTTESKALRHAFFAERVASKVPDVPADTPTRAIKSAAVIGAGTMGGGIAMNFATPAFRSSCWKPAGSAGQGPGDDPQELRKHHEEGQADAGEVRSAHGLISGTWRMRRSARPTSWSKPCSRTWASRKPCSASSTK
jgi:3-hydroxyacyl-CoA dehydrogenase